MPRSETESTYSSRRSLGFWNNLRRRLWRLMPFVAYHHVLMFVLVLEIAALALLLAGCCSEAGNFRGIYVLSLKTSDPTSTPAGHIAVRAGYFGLCASSGGQTSWICRTGRSAITTDLSLSQADTTHIMAMADHFSNDVIFPGLVIGAIAFSLMCSVGLATFSSWHVEIGDNGSEVDIKPFPSRRVTQICTITTSLSTLLALTAALWQHIAAAAAASMVEEATGGQVVGHVGAAAAVLAWLGFGFSALVTIGMVVMILSIRLLDQLVDD